MLSVFPVRIQLTFAACFFGGVFLWLGYEEQQKAKQVKQTPQILGCDELADSEPTDNKHVTVRDFWPSDGGYIFYEQDYGPDWDDVYVAVYSRKRVQEPPADRLRVILHLWDVNNEDQLYGELDKNELTGVVWSRGDELLRDAQQLLEETYPGIALSDCWVVNVGGRLPSTANAQFFMAIGAFGILLGSLFIVWMVWEYTRPSVEDESGFGDDFSVSSNERQLVGVAEEDPF